MNKKLITILLLSILFLGILYQPTQITADSGFDSSYDSGSSWSSSSYDSSSSWGSSGHDSSSYSSDIFLTMSVILMLLIGGIILNIIKKLINHVYKSCKIFRIIYLIIGLIIGGILIILYIFNTNISENLYLITLIFILILIIIRKKKKTNIITYANSQKYKKLSNDIIKNQLPDLNIEEFNKIVFKNYKTIQEAWMNFDLDTIKNLVSDEIYNMYSMQLDTLKVKGQTNIMENISYIDNYIVDINKQNDIITIQTILQVICNDYIINNKNSVVRGNRKQKLHYTYKLTFAKQITETTNICPNCGATLDNKNTTNCYYCSSIMPHNNNNWIMTKKEMIEQKKV